MAVNRTPVLKRCRSLDLDPIYLGIDKKSNRHSQKGNKKISEYGLQLVNIPSYLVKAGDTVEIKESCKSSDRYKAILETTAGRLVPEWLESDQENLKGVVKELPTRDMIDVPVNEMLIVELYSK